jgi:hypothetical protein
MMLLHVPGRKEMNTTQPEVRLVQYLDAACGMPGVAFMD